MTTKPIYRMTNKERLAALQPLVGRLVVVAVAPFRNDEVTEHAVELVSVTAGASNSPGFVIMRRPEDRLADPTARYATGPVDTAVSLAQVAQVVQITDPDRVADLQARAIGARR